MIAPAGIRPLAVLAAVLFGGAATAEPLSDLDALFPVGEPACFVGEDATPPVAATEPGSDRENVPIAAVRLERSFPELHGEDRNPPDDTDLDERGGRKRGTLVSVIVTYRDAGQRRQPKRFVGFANCYADTTSTALRCTADTCDGGHFIVDRQAEGGVILRLLERGFTVSGGCGSDKQHRSLPRGHVFSLKSRPMAACR
jgi:hypothetical protein